jgi:hypothetical protein
MFRQPKMQQLAILSFAVALCLLSSSPVSAQDKGPKIYVRVLAIKASGKLGKTATFDKGCKHLEAALKKLPFGNYTVIKSFKKACDQNAKLQFDLGFDHELALKPSKKEKRFVTIVSLSSVSKDKAGKKLLKKLLDMKAKSKDGKSVILGSRKIKKENFQLLIVLTVQSKPFP